MSKFKKIIILETQPNAVSYVAHEIDKDGNDRYYYRHLDWEKPYRDGINKGDEFFLINREDVDERRLCKVRNTELLEVLLVGRVRDGRRKHTLDDGEHL